MSTTRVQVSKDREIGYVSLNQPPANALSQTMIEEIDDAFEQLREDKDVKAVILHGEGRFFAAGADIKEFTKTTGKTKFTQLAKSGQQVFSKIEAFPKPVIAVIHGAALGGGLELAMACHIRLVTKEAKLGLPELQLGLIPGFAGTQRLPRLVGKAKATEMLLTAEPVSGEEACRIGLANHFYEEDEIMDNAVKMARKMGNKSATSIKFALELLNLSEDATVEVGQEKEAERFGDISETDDAKEGIMAFIEKRKPSFKDQ
ncbi:enoyl-CoA hydratase [Litchfieldia alkalitelluris]|uniref:enoyl-CoA hydratase n=1 Tax=Litchfieldia alkalitelluris TaxID=304268 RepID=UPI001F25E487|nr:enoyl-CoA hydratase [Litchfieldia alkalitelluris]